MKYLIIGLSGRESPVPMATLKAICLLFSWVMNFFPLYVTLPLHSQHLSPCPRPWNHSFILECDKQQNRDHESSHYAPRFNNLLIKVRLGGNRTSVWRERTILTPHLSLYESGLMLTCRFLPRCFMFFCCWLHAFQATCGNVKKHVNELIQSSIETLLTPHLMGCLRIMSSFSKEEKNTWTASMCVCIYMYRCLHRIKLL